MHVVIGKMTKKTFIFQASIAMEMAEAIMFVNSSDVMLAANTIINTVDKAGGNEAIKTHGCCNCGCESSRLRSNSKISSVCLLL